ncbi:uncharacterized protein BX664DRAFT_268967 [Halteromyces radiatus]|uniref:uncharacterized protein n=1 Tax=Halteromyces radiatus TaxID=101107 RepID=UPI00221EC57B|nr:uncharacterized protein BX664DRAFT_268967 [Halteromyces radiatus]KAI8081526.1 hypothetical protein BX664DRAFT_268967 [Halteromyces radiatus]
MSSLDAIKSSFNLTKDQFQAIVNGFKQEYEQGLNTAEAKGLATMIPSYVTRLPTGQEKGTFLALDIGGSTLRVCAVELLGQGQVKVNEVKRSIPMTDPLRTGEIEPFFDWMVDTVDLLLKEYHLDTTTSSLSMGVSWSFPIDQTSVSDGKILRMGKGFDLKGIEGQDLKTLFMEAFQRKNVKVKVTALINDTVGVLVAHAYNDPKARIGFIYGTGTNAAYPEKVSKMVKLNKDHSLYQDDAEMLVNTEIDIFGSDAYLPLNRFDRLLDANHNQPEFQLYEKMMSGAYLGELVRLAALELVKEKYLFDGHIPLEFKDMYSFESSQLSDLESRSADALEVRLQHFASMFTFDTPIHYQPTEKDLTTMTELCRSVATRGAKLAGAALASLIEQQYDLFQDPKEPIVIGINGSTFELYPQMPDRILTSLSDWFGPEITDRIRLEVARDGAGIGGALIAMLYAHDEEDDDL